MKSELTTSIASSCQHDGPFFQQSVLVYPQSGPYYPQSGPVYPHSGPAYPQAGPAYPQSGPVYPQSGPVYQHSGPGYQQSGPGYQQSEPAYIPGLNKLLYKCFQEYINSWEIIGTLPYTALRAQITPPPLFLIFLFSSSNSSTCGGL